MMKAAYATIEKLIGDETEDIWESDDDEEHNNNNSSSTEIENKFSDDDESQSASMINEFLETNIFLEIAIDIYDMVGCAELPELKLKATMICMLGVTCLYLNMIILAELPPITATTAYYTQNTTSLGIVKQWPLCPDWCNGINCLLPSCAHCEFTCTTICQDTLIPPVHHHINRVKDCLPINFIDVTKKTLQLEYFNNYPQMGRAKNSEYSPLFVDINNDGVLDLFDFSHQEIKDIIESILLDENGDGNNNITTLHPLKDRIIIEDYNASKLDTHGINIIDLDNDGILDIYISVGGGKGGAMTYFDDKEHRTRNILLWGELDKQKNNTIIFRGGQDEAAKAGIDMILSRGRMNYILDVNNDGYYDIFCGTDRRVTNEITPGVLFINNGNRTFSKDETMQEYSKVMIYTDVDGDGYANEFVIARDLCFPMRNGPDVDENYPQYGPFSNEVIQFCSTRPVSTTAVYKYSRQKQSMINIGKQYKNISEYNFKQPACCPHGSYYTKCCAKSLGSADFDGDLLADHVFLYSTKIKFFYSSHRPKGVLPFAKQYVSDVVYIPDECNARAIRIVDIDNDGYEEILVMCRTEPHQILIYRRINTSNIKDGWFLNDGCPHKYGDLNNLSQLALVTEDDIKLACKYQQSHKVTNHICQVYRGKRSHKFFLEGMTIVDMNNDGYLDLIITFGYGHIIFLYNKPIDDGTLINRFIAFKLKGTQSNIHGIGSTVILYYHPKEIMCNSTSTSSSKLCSNNNNINATAAALINTQFREISSHQHASDNQGYNDDRIIFGLGNHGVPIKVLVRWPTGLSKTYNLDNWVYSPKLKVVEIVE